MARECTQVQALHAVLAREAVRRAAASKAFGTALHFALGGRGESVAVPVQRRIRGFCRFTPAVCDAELGALR